MTISKEKIYELIREQNDVSKNDILETLAFKMDYYSKESTKEGLKPTTYYSILLIYFLKLYEKVESSILFDELPDGWIYRLSFEYDEFSLNLEHIKKYNLDDNLKYKSMSLDAIYKIITVKPDTFSVEQYALAYDVGPGTVRQWIRRGKIRTAFKEGNEWKIPHLTLPPSRGYESAQYKWFNGIDNLPEEYRFLSEYALATFFQDQKDKNKYHVLLLSRETFKSDNKEKKVTTKNRELLLDSKDRERLELFLIAHPQVKYCGELI